MSESHSVMMEMIAALSPIPAPALGKDVIRIHLHLAFSPGERRREVNSPTMLMTNQDCDAMSSLRIWDINQDRPFAFVLDAYTSLASRSLLLRSRMESSIQSNRAGVSDGSS